MYKLSILLLFLCAFIFSEALAQDEAPAIDSLFVSDEQVVAVFHFRRLVEETNPFDGCGHEVWENTHVSEGFKLFRDGEVLHFLVYPYTSEIAEVGSMTGMEAFSQEGNLVQILRKGYYEGSSAVRNACIVDDAIEPLRIIVFFSTEGEARRFSMTLGTMARI